MEYLLLPTHPTMPPIEVTFQDKETYWHEGNWDEHVAGKYWDSFPRRYGYHLGEWWDEAGSHGNKAWSHPGFHHWISAMSDNKLHSVMIAWLYFGTLSEVTCCQLDVDQYLAKGSCGQPILSLTSKQFDDLFGLWLTVQLQFKGSRYVRGYSRLAKIKTESVAFLNNKDNIRTLTHILPDSTARVRLDANRRSTAFEQAHRCLRRSKAILGLFCERLNAAAVFVIASLHETLAHLLWRVFAGEVGTAYDNIHSQYSLGRWTLGMDFCHFSHNRWKDLGWCPRTITSLLADKTRTLAYDYALSNIKSPQSDEDHTACSEAICLAHQVEEKNYPRAHSSEDCSCPDLTVETEVAKAILIEPASFPLVRLDGDRNSAIPALELFNAAEATNFIAVSHVWSHGLGNPNENSLPLCQVQRIQGLVDELASSEPTNPNNSTLFWIDTLCCPVEPATARKAAIQRMALTYRQAAHVLVLDRDLQHLTTSALSDLDLLLYILSSTWTTRLWTLQEAKFARKLWFQFKDKAVNLDDLHARFASSEQTSATRLVARDLIISKTSSSLYGLRTELSSPTGLADIESSINSIISVPFSLLGRSTSRAGDEPICICTLLGYDLTPVLKFPASDIENRMMAFWKQVSNVPPGIIFNGGTRLKSQGFRWAPETFIRTRGTNIELFPPNERALIDPQHRGLIVHMPGWKLKTVNGFHAAREHTAGRLRHKTFLIRDADDSTKWYDVDIEQTTHGPLSYVDLDAEIGIIMTPYTNTMNVDPRGRMGLLVCMTKQENGVIFAQSLCILRVSESEAGAAKLFACCEWIAQMYALGAGSVPGFIPHMMRSALEQPGIKIYVQRTLARNASEYQTWFAATEVQRADWGFRCDHGDAKLFLQGINFWMNVTSKVQALPTTQEWCVD